MQKLNSGTPPLSAMLCFAMILRSCGSVGSEGRDATSCSTSFSPWDWVRERREAILEQMLVRVRDSWWSSSCWLRDIGREACDWSVFAARWVARR